ncbi:MAG: ankyrin repeat domain-containing protein [Truepera sp.]|nr:ankyrin repeat domain-containing protein [Truepera sp.]
MNRLTLLIAIAALMLAGQAVGCEGWEKDQFFSFYTTLEAVTDCLATGADVHVRDVDGYTPLHWAVIRVEAPAVIRVLIEAGAELEARTKGNGETPLHKAVKWGEPDIIRVLLKAGANLEAQSSLGNTPLHLAAREHGNPAVIKILVGAGALLEARNLDGYTPLHYAARSNTPAVIKALLDLDADVTAQNSDGKTPWGYARSRPDLKGSEVLSRLKE